MKTFNKYLSERSEIDELFQGNGLKEVGELAILAWKKDPIKCKKFFNSMSSGDHKMEELLSKLPRYDNSLPKSMNIDDLDNEIIPPESDGGTSSSDEG